MFLQTIWFIFCAGLLTSEKLHSDAELNNFFIQNETAFHELTNPISNKEQTQQLEKKLDVKITNPCSLETSAISLTSCGRGMAFSTSAYKGYIYSEKSLSPLFDSLDEEPLAYQKKCAYKKLKKNWYLFYISYP